MKNRPLRLAGMMCASFRWRRDYDAAQVDVFSGPSFRWAEAACLVLRRVRKPYVLTLHGGNLPQFASEHPSRVRRLLCSAAAVTSPSRYLADSLSTFCAGIRVLPNALEIGNYSFRLRENPTPELVWLRAFHDMYNPGLAVRAVALLADEYPCIHLTMIGRDKGDGSLGRTRELACELGIAASVTFIEGVPKAEVPHVLDRADIFLNTTNVDNTPVSLLEAMASGLCVVTTEAGGLRYAVRDGIDGLIAPVGDAAGMAACIRRILRTENLAAHLSSEARRSAEALDWSCVLPQWESIFDSVVRGAVTCACA